MEIDFCFSIDIFENADEVLLNQAIVEIYLIGTNFVFKKFKFHIDKNLAPQTQNDAEAPGHSILISHHKQDRRSTYRLESTTKVSIHFVDKKIFIFASIFEMKNIILSIDPNLFKKNGKSQYL